MAKLVLLFFGRLVDRFHWGEVLKGKGVWESWTFFKNKILNTQEQTIPMFQKMCQCGTFYTKPEKNIRSNLKEAVIYHLYILTYMRRGTDINWNDSLRNTWISVWKAPTQGKKENIPKDRMIISLGLQKDFLYVSLSLFS